MTLTRLESLALSSAVHSEMPRWEAVINTRINASASTHSSTGMMSTSAPALWVCVASTTLSTMRAPTQATPEGNTPAMTVMQPRNIASGRLVDHRSSSARLL